MRQGCGATLLLTSRTRPIYKATFPQVIRILFLLALPLAICSPGSAASLQGKVAEVLDGGTIVVISANHPIKVRLIAAAAPEKDQSYAGVARQHLSDLILNKYVVVHFSALRDGYLAGQVLLGDMDVGAQMIRDGVAWYDKSDEKRLSQTEQRIYAESQDAARNERRGLWQDESPMSPWDFRRAQLATVNATVNTSTLSAPRQPSPVRKGSRAGLSSEDLMGGVIGPGSIAGKPDIRPISLEGSPGRWLRYQPADRHFSILAPSDGLEITYPVLDSQGKAVEFHYVIGNDGRTLYFVMWTKGPNGSSTDVSAAADAVNGMLSGINRTTERAGFVLTATPGRNLRLTGYAGRQYTLTGGPATGVVRILSKQIGDEREVFMLCVLNGPEGEASGDEFLNSFKIRQNQPQ
jgi:endonuclease YncB( thermonuclease family)